MRPRRLARVALLLALAWPCALAHLLVSIVAELRVDGGATTVTLSVDRNAMLIAIGEFGLANRREVDVAPLTAALEAYVRERLALGPPGVGAAPDSVRLVDRPPLPDAAAHTPSEARLTFVATWASPPRPATTFTTQLFQGANFPSVLLLRVAGVPGDVQQLQPGDSCAVAAPAPPDDPHALAPSPPAAPPRRLGFGGFVAMGFNHIIPEGLDHILFVLGLALLCRSLKPLLAQVTAFTVAHSLTLALAVFDLVPIPSRVIETTIALSIAAIAIENVLVDRVRPRRWLIAFAFGLVHGVGFASNLDRELWRGSGFVQALVGFNVGVECAQLAVVLTAVAATCWWWSRRWYRRAVVVPGSIAIGLVGLFWAIERGFGVVLIATAGPTVAAG